MIHYRKSLAHSTHNAVQLYVDSCTEVETGDSLLLAPRCQTDPRLSQSWKDVFQTVQSGPIRITSRVWKALVWKWWVCRTGHCPIACSTAPDCAVLTPAGPSLTFKEPNWRSKLSTAARTIMSLFLDPYVILLLCSPGLQSRWRFVGK